MRTSLLGLGLSVLVAGATGCVVSSNGPSSPDMTIDVTFENAGCAAAHVGTVRLTFVNPVVGAPQDFRCDLEPMGIRVPNLATGTYRVRLEGFADNDPNFVAFSDQFDVVHTQGGTHEYALDLHQTTEVLTEFTFAGYQNQLGMTCDEAGITTVSIVVDDSLRFDRVACHSGTRDAASLTGVNPGNHTFVVHGLDAAGNELYSSRIDVQVNPGASNAFTFNFLPLAKAGLEFRWDFGPQHLDCASAGIASVEFTLVDAAGNEVYTGAVACTQMPVSFRHDNAQAQLDAGLYALATIKGRAVNGAAVYGTSSVPLYAPAGRTQGFVVSLTHL